MTRKRPTASDDVQLRSLDRHPRRETVRDVLTPAQAHALSRSAPLTPAQFKARRRLAEQPSLPLQVVLGRAAGTSSPMRLGNDAPGERDR